MGWASKIVHSRGQSIKIVQVLCMSRKWRTGQREFSCCQYWKRSFVLQNRFCRLFNKWTMKASKNVFEKRTYFIRNQLVNKGFSLVEPLSAFQFRSEALREHLNRKVRFTLAWGSLQVFYNTTVFEFSIIPKSNAKTVFDLRNDSHLHKQWTGFLTYVFHSLKKCVFQCPSSPLAT